jgi:transcriptional regulator
MTQISPGSLYNPRWFKEERVDVLRNEVDHISFGTLVTVNTSGISASHVPMLIDRSRGELGTLFGHVARGNSQWRDSPAGGQGLAIFLGPDAYVSPSWYPTKKETGKVVPTWNYVAIHVRGPVTFFEDIERIREIVTKLTKHHEAGSKKPWEVTDAPADYIDGELRSIVGFEMPIAKIEGKWKMSQNRPEGDRESVITNLMDRHKLRDEEVSREMKGRS